VDLSELKERIARWEDLHTEFKQWPVQPDDLAAGLVAFANTDGGQLVLGVSDNRQIVGVDDPDNVTHFVDNIATNSCEPPVTVIQEVLLLADAPEKKAVVVVNIPKGEVRPYRTNRGVFYVRTTSGRRQASREELLRLFQATESLYYDETPLPRLRLADLDFGSFEHYLEKIGLEELKDDPERLLVNWRLLSNGHPTIAGLILFGRDPQRHLPFAQINAAGFFSKACCSTNAHGQKGRQRKKKPGHSQRPPQAWIQLDGDCQTPGLSLHDHQQDRSPDNCQKLIFRFR